MAVSVEFPGIQRNDARVFLRAYILLTLGVAALALLFHPLRAEEPSRDPLAEAHYRSALQDANVAIQKKNYAKAQEAVEKAESLLGQNPTTWNLRGAVQTKEKKWDEAQKCFERALEIEPNFFPAKFNQGEVLFLMKDYPAARAHFSEMLARAPQSELLQFKVFLCDLLAGDREAAEKRLSKIRHPGETPAWYYAQSAWSFKEGKPKEGREYIRSARFIFGGDKTSLFDETFEDIEIGR